MNRPACVVIDRQAAIVNLQRVRQLAPRQRVMAIIKADAYGHGLVRMASAFSEADAFGVACLEEALQLREAGIEKPIVLLEGPFSRDEMKALGDENIETVLHCEEQLRMLDALPDKIRIRVWLKIDTGMHRLGFSSASFGEVWQRLQDQVSVVKPVGLMTHLAQANERGDEFSLEQIALFNEVVGNRDGARCIANSAAVISIPESRANWVRPGLMLYGVSPFDDSIGAEEGLHPVMTLCSKLIAVKRAKAGDTVGYGRTWECPEDMSIGVIAMGYGDGYPRHASSGTPILVNGIRAALIGRPSMDMLTVDLRQCPNAAVGDPVILWGRGLPVEEVARHANTIPYHLMCCVRMRARFIEDGEE